MSLPLATENFNFQIIVLRQQKFKTNTGQTYKSLPNPERERYRNA